MLNSHFVSSEQWLLRHRWSLIAVVHTTQYNYNWTGSRYESDPTSIMEWRDFEHCSTSFENSQGTSLIIIIIIIIPCPISCTWTSVWITYNKHVDLLYYDLLNKSVVLINKHVEIQSTHMNSINKNADVINNSNNEFKTDTVFFMNTIDSIMQKQGGATVGPSLVER